MCAMHGYVKDCTWKIVKIESKNKNCDEQKKSIDIKLNQSSSGNQKNKKLDKNLKILKSFDVAYSYIWYAR